MNSGHIQTITLGMGCFWTPEALFGQLEGVLRTRVGYAGGTQPNPSYKNLGDHSEMVELEFDPVLLPLKDILRLFWQSHNPANINDYKGRQYRSLLLYRDEEQLCIIQQVIRERAAQGQDSSLTEITPYTGFTWAEDRHQKYYVKRYPDALAKLTALYPSHHELVNATLTARLNGLAKGFTNLSRVIQEIEGWAISAGERERLIHTIRQIKW